MTITEVRLPCPECHDPAKARRIVPEVAGTILPARIDGIACSNFDCPRFDALAWSTPAP
jgi:hypothetical protein